MRIKFFFIFVLILSFGFSGVSAQKPAAKSAPKIINSGVVNGKAISLPKPEYPAAAQAVEAGGEVKVQITIDEQGNVISASAVSGHPLLQQVAEQAARQAKFSPTTLAGQPVKVSGVIVYNFVPVESSDETPAWAFGMMLSLIQSTDSNLIDEIGDEMKLNSTLTEMAADIPEDFASEKNLFDKLAKTRGEERRAVAGELLISVKKYLSPEEKWQIEVGESFGAVLPELLKYKKRAAGDRTQIDESSLKINLQKLKDSLISAPANTSLKLIKNFNKVADFAAVSNLSSSANLELLLNAIEPLFDNLPDDK